MKKNIIIYIIAGVIVLGGLATGGVVAVKKHNANKDNSTSEATVAFEDFGTDGYTVVEEPTSETMTDEDGNIVELYTDEEGNTHEAVVVTDVNGEIVTELIGTSFLWGGVY